MYVSIEREPDQVQEVDKLNKEKYFVHLQKQIVSQTNVTNEHGITIYATEEEVKELERLFIELQSADFTSFLRALVHIKLYHKMEYVEEFDESYKEISKNLYVLGDEEAKKFIRESGIIGSRPIDTEYTYPDPEHDGGKEA